jgi:guanyl-specific ribonuclease Sa
MRRQGGLRRAFLLCFVLVVAPLQALAVPQRGAPAARSPAREASHWIARVGNTFVDVTPTMERIASGGSTPYRHDGTRFHNRERRLAPGHTYTEYVVPTPGISGPGPQRIVIDETGKANYTPDHCERPHR